MKNKVLALSAISASFVAILLTIGAYIEFADVFTIIIASAFILLPLYYKSYKGCFLCYIAGGVIAFIISGFNILSIVFPSYFVFFGIYPIVKMRAIDKKFNKIIFMIIGLIWCVGVIYGIYFYYTFVMKIEFDELTEKIAFIMDYLYITIAVIGVIFYFLFDRFIVVVKRLLDYYLPKIIKGQ
ncbi:MAG: hypothetical protein MJ066_04225 [Clostridia bacterium]|nr:hypothetical protein [Clostridia bacterium]